MKASSSTHSFCAFLRGVNVKGTNMKMADVCTVFSNTGVTNVSSVLASGNILFSSDKERNELKPLLEKAMADHFSYEAFMFIKSREEVETIFRDNPFEAHTDFHIYGFVGIDHMEKVLMSEYEKCAKAEGEEGRVIGKNFYWKTPKGNTLGSEFGKILGRKNLKDSFTSRNINTFERVLKKMPVSL